MGKKFRGAVLLAVFLAAAAWFFDSAPSSSHGDFVQVASGMAAGRVAALLESRGEIRSRRWFLALAVLERNAAKIQAGAYQISPGQPASRILQDMVSGRTRKVHVTVPEGFASWQIAERLEAGGVCAAGEFRTEVASAAAEGYLSPETYYFDERMPARAVVDAMRDRFRRVWEEILKSTEAAGIHPEPGGNSADDISGKYRLADGGVWRLGDVVTLASLIEREASREDERSRISAVFHNRLKKKMLLETDPTVQFSLGYWKERILFKDLDTDSPYNTYRHRGLPPGPICSPGRASLLAALVPMKTDDLYFVADGLGGHVFSATYASHVRLVQKRNQERRNAKARR